MWKDFGGNKKKSAKKGKKFFKMTATKDGCPTVREFHEGKANDYDIKTRCRVEELVAQGFHVSFSTGIDTEALEESENRVVPKEVGGGK